MSPTKKPYKGTRDFFPPQQRIQDFLFSKMRDTAESFGYENYNGPLLEEVELYKAKSGEELINEQIYSFTDRGERFLAIRPEMTPTLARMVAQVHREYPRPLRWYSIPNLMRYENPQRGRLREHWQFNCDIFGAPEGQGELEIILLSIQLFENFGATKDDFEICVNDRKIVDFLFKKLMNVEEGQSYKLYKIIDKSKKMNADALDKMIKELQLNPKAQSHFFEYLRLTSFEELFSFLKKYEFGEAGQSLQTMYEKIQQLNSTPYLKYDPCIVRGLDYYTGLVFEIFDKDPLNRRALCGGGSYANLLEIFNESPLPGIGFGLGDVTLTDFLQTHKLLPDLSKPQLDIFLCFQDECGEIPSFNLSKTLRKHQVSVTLHLSPLKLAKAFPMAEKKGANFIALIGSNEVENNTFCLKNLKTKEQKEFSISDINQALNYITHH